MNYFFEVVNYIDADMYHWVYEKSVRMNRDAYLMFEIHYLVIGLHYLVVGIRYFVMVMYYLVIGIHYLVVGRYYLVVGRYYIVVEMYYLVVGRYYLVVVMHYLVVGRYYLVVEVQSSIWCYGLLSSGDKSVKRNVEVVITQYASILNTFMHPTYDANWFGCFEKCTQWSYLYTAVSMWLMFLLWFW